MEPGSENYGTVALEQSCPAGGDEGSPFLPVVPEKQGSDVSVVAAANRKALLASLAHLKPDAVIGVDNGGDSLTS